MKHFYTLLLASSLMSLHAQTSFVNSTATGTNDGTSWENAWTNLQTALQSTSSGEIWIAEGTYKPTTDTDRDISFEPPLNVNLYGGFPAIGSPAWEDRNVETFPTILSGDIGIESDTSDNSYHIMSLSSFSTFDNTIDGMVFTLGHSDYSGGAIDISGSSSFTSSVTISNCVFKENFADYEGAGIDASRVDLTIENCTFEDNYSGYEGAAVSYFGDHFPTTQIQLVCKNSIFRNNYADYEGAAISSSRTDLVVEDCVFNNNQSGYGGGAISYFSDHFPTDEIQLICKNSIFENNQAEREGGAAATRGHNSWYNCLFLGNYAENEGGVFSHFSDGIVTATNCTFIDNATDGDGSIIEMFSFNDTIAISASFKNSIFNNNGTSLFDKGGSVDSILLHHSLISSCPPDVYCEEGNVFDDNPGFIGADDYRLAANSLCIDAGSNDYLPTNLFTDLDGNARILNNTVDLGAYEFDNTVSTNEITQVITSIFPNPTSDILHIQSQDAILQSTISNIQGQVVHNLVSKGKTYLQINVKDLPKGFYTLSLFGQNWSSVESFIIQ